MMRLLRRLQDTIHPETPRHIIKNPVRTRLPTLVDTIAEATTTTIIRDFVDGILEVEEVEDVEDSHAVDVVDPEIMSFQNRKQH